MSGADFAAVDENGRVDWVRAKAAGLDFCYLNATPGNSVWSQAQAARDAGVVVGPYYFPVVSSHVSHRDEMERCLRALDNAETLPHDLPWVVDVELPHGVAGTGMKRRQVCDRYLEVFDRLGFELGYQPGEYSSRRVLDTEDTDCLARGLDSLLTDAGSWLWLAYYVPGASRPAVPIAAGDDDNWWIWQDRGDVRGAFGIRQVDRDLFNYLRPGATGQRVRWWQMKLRVTVTGTFDDETLAATKALQLASALDVDGVVGPRTFAVGARL